MVYYLLYTTVGGFGIVWCDHLLGGFLGIIVGTTVFAVVCIIRDAYFRPNQSKGSAVAVINIILLCQGVIGVMHLCDGTVVEDGVLSGDAVQLFLLLMLVIIDITFIVKSRMEKREEQE